MLPLTEKELKLRKDAKKMLHLWKRNLTKAR